jgi:flavin reductase (DIM6/NTAB) family NADH-FMN oxidoreductase RutF
MSASFSPDADNQIAFREALGSFATGVTVVTTIGPDGPVGMTANSFASVSLDPPLVLWSPAKASTRYKAFEQARHFAIHVLSAEQVDLCRRFTRGGAGFRGLEHAVNAADVPLLEGALARFECDTASLHDGGDHTIILGRVTRVTRNAGEPLCFAKGTFGRFETGV